MAVSRGAQRIGEILVQAGLVDPMQLKSGLRFLEQWGGRLPRSLSEMGLADEYEMAGAIGKAYGLQVVTLGTQPKDTAALKLFQPEYCKQRGVFPVSLHDRTLTLAVSDPSDLATLDDAKAKAPGKVVLVLTTESSVLHAIERHYFNRMPRVVSNRARKAVTRDLPAQEVAAPALELDAAPPPALESSVPESTFDFADLDGEGWTPELLARLEKTRANQEKTTLMLSVVRELLFEKGVLDE